MSTDSKFVSTLKRWGKELYYFFGSLIFWRNLGGIIAMLALLLFLTSWWMRCYTNHGESKQVHNYIGMDLDDAVRKAKDHTFSIVVNDSVYMPGKDPNMVIDQNPKPLSRVKEKRKIYLTVTKRDAELVTLPNLYGGNDDFASYKRKLTILGLNYKVASRRFSSKLEENTILEVIYKGDTITDDLDSKYRIPKGTTVEFIITERGGGKVPVPNLVCQKYDGARFVIGNFNLNVGSIINDATVTNESTAYIWKQVPRYRRGTTLRIGEQIDLYLTQQKPDNCGQEDEFNIEDEAGDSEGSGGDTEEDEEFE